MKRRLVPIIVCAVIAAAIAPVLGYFTGQTFVRRFRPASQAVGQPASEIAAKAASAAPARAARPAAAAGRQAAARPAGTNASAPPTRPSEMRKMLDSYALMQAQEQLKISSEKFPAFMAQYQNLQELRRTSTQEHLQLLQQLRTESGDAKAADAQLKVKLKGLHDFEETSHADVRKAYDAIDRILDVRQQARFRVFEQQMNQRMLQLAARARQAGAKPPTTKAVK